MTQPAPAGGAPDPRLGAQGSPAATTTAASREAATNADLAGEPTHSSGRAWWMVAVLMVVYVFSFADRQILTLMVDDLKTGFGLTQDWQVSILMGPAFAIFYSIFGFPLGRLADRTSRRSVIAVGLTAWSLSPPAAASRATSGRWRSFASASASVRRRSRRPPTRSSPTTSRSA